MDNFPSANDRYVFIYEIIFIFRRDSECKSEYSVEGHEGNLNWVDIFIEEQKETALKTLRTLMKFMSVSLV